MRFAVSAILLIAAVCVDGLQWLVEFILFVIGLIPGTLGAATVFCAAGAAVAGKTGCAIAGIAGGVAGSILNPIIGTVSVPLAAVIGFGIASCVGLVFGSVVLLLLITNGMFYPTLITAAFAGEAIPGFNMLPLWTMIVILCLLRKKAESGEGVGNIVAGLALAPVAPAQAGKTFMRRAAHTAGAAIQPNRPAMNPARQGTAAGLAAAGLVTSHTPGTRWNSEKEDHQTLREIKSRAVTEVTGGTPSVSRVRQMLNNSVMQNNSYGVPA